MSKTDYSRWPRRLECDAKILRAEAKRTQTSFGNQSYGYRARGSETRVSWGRPIRVSKTHRRHEHRSKHGILKSLDENNAGCIAGLLAVVKQCLTHTLVKTGCTQRGATVCKWVADREREPVLPAVEDAPDIFKRSEALV